MGAREEIKSRLQTLLPEGDELIVLAQNYENLMSFSVKYQTWYTRALRIVDALAPDRAAEFRNYYLIDPKRKMLSYGNYVIQDYIKGIAARNGAWDIHQSTAMNVLNQLNILQSLQTRLDSVLSDVRGHLFAELQDAELAAAAELIKISPRAAGALARVVLERHLRQVAANHSVNVKKKDPTIADLNDPLRAADVYDMATWRKLQYLADLGNLCSHQKGADPTVLQVQELIEGVNWAIKTLT